MNSAKVLTEAEVDLQVVFMKADSGFDAEVLREQCLQKEIEEKNLKPMCILTMSYTKNAL